MATSYKYIISTRWTSCVNSRAIKDFMAGKAKGSTGRPPWWTLTTREQKEFLGKKV